MSAIPNPFWIMLSANKEKELVSILGFSDKPEAEAVEIAKSRAEPGSEVRCFGVHNDAAAMATAMRTWLMSVGVPEDEANNLISQLAHTILEKDGGLKKRRRYGTQ